MSYECSAELGEKTGVDGFPLLKKKDNNQLAPIDPWIFSGYFMLAVQYPLKALGRYRQDF